MDCWPRSIQHALERVRCTLACCHSTVIIQDTDVKEGQDDHDGKNKTSRKNILRSFKSSKFWRCRGCLPCCKVKRQEPTPERCEELATDTEHVHSPQTSEEKVQEKPRRRVRRGQPMAVRFSRHVTFV